MFRESSTDTALNPVSTLVAADYETRLSALAARLDTYRKLYEEKKDSRAVFTYAYVGLTRILTTSIRDNNFKQPEWVVLLAESFAREYFEALDATDQNRMVSAAWKEVFDTLRSSKTSVLEDLVFAMTAHIVHDLPIALNNVGLGDDNATTRVTDFHRINDLLANNVPVIQNAVLKRYAPFLRVLDHLEKGYGQILSNYGFRLSRGMAWYNASRLLDRKSRTEVEASITRSTIILIQNVRNPPWWSVRLFSRLARLLVGMLRVWPNPNR